MVLGTHEIIEEYEQKLEAERQRRAAAEAKAAKIDECEQKLTIERQRREAAEAKVDQLTAALNGAVRQRLIDVLDALERAAIEVESFAEDEDVMPGDFHDLKEKIAAKIRGLKP